MGDSKEAKYRQIVVQQMMAVWPQYGVAGATVERQPATQSPTIQPGYYNITWAMFLSRHQRERML